MEFGVLSALVGGACGAVIGLLKYLFLWRKFFADAGKEEKGPQNAGVSWRYLVSMAVNAGVLLAVYLTRNTLPYDYIWFLLGLAIALSLSGRLYSIKRVLNMKPDSKEQQNINSE